jgi:uncharacterized protein YjbJ (UPF0337 family)
LLLDGQDDLLPLLSWLISQAPEGKSCPRRWNMGTDDKLENKAQELGGKAKERVGEATDDEQLEAEGRTDQAKADVKQAGEKIKDAFKR